MSAFGPPPCAVPDTASAANVGPVRIATWNVNSVKQRVPRLLPWLDQRKPDVVCLQEIKLSDEAFTDLLGDDSRNGGYKWPWTGRRRWKGWASLPKVGLDVAALGLLGAQGSPTPRPEQP